jgi:hypothetical protein
MVARESASRGRAGCSHQRNACYRDASTLFELITNVYGVRYDQICDLSRSLKVGSLSPNNLNRCRALSASTRTTLSIATIVLNRFGHIAVLAVFRQIDRASPSSDWWCVMWTFSQEAGIIAAWSRSPDFFGISDMRSVLCAEALQWQRRRSRLWH